MKRKINFHLSHIGVIQIINTRKEELIGRLRVVNSQWEIDEEYLDEVVNILNELGLKFDII